jgi:hypothetical protein
MLIEKGCTKVRSGVSSIEAAHNARVTPFGVDGHRAGENACPAGIPVAMPLEEAE